MLQSEVYREVGAERYKCSHTCAQPISSAPRCQRACHERADRDGRQQTQPVDRALQDARPAQRLSEMKVDEPLINAIDNQAKPDESQREGWNVNLRSGLDAA